MLVFRILATVFVSLSVITGLSKNLVLFASGEKKEVKIGSLIGWSIWSLLWRAFVITAIWLI